MAVAQMSIPVHFSAEGVTVSLVL